MGHFRNLLFIMFIAAFSAGGAQMQDGTNPTKQFEKNGLEFDYPATWAITEGSGEKFEYVELALTGKTTQLVVTWQFGDLLDCELEGARIRTTQALVERVAGQLHTTVPDGTTWQETRLAKLRTDQIRLTGQMNNAPVIADIYSLTVKRHFLNLLYLRTATDDSAGTSWPTIQSTLKIAKTAPLDKLAQPVAEKILKGKAIRLPRPVYPPGRRIGGVVEVQVLISEAGNVMAACALSGPRELRDYSVTAARGALFTPTKLSGKPVRVTGVISYNFFSQ
jgi:hypothetical protein